MNEANGGNIIYHIKADVENFNKNLDGVKSALGKAGKVASTLSGIVVGATTVAGVALMNMASDSLKAYGEVEQSIGGIETLFGDSAQKVVENARKAYKTAGVDANTYMQEVASFSASLLQATGNNAEKSAEIADMAFQDMSDNANKFGSDMKSITKAYSGFARGQFNMLDNLKLGYSGTKKEMERLLADAEKISGVHYDISNLADIYNAIHVIQGELKITGTTANESMNTLTGSINSAKMAWQNFLSGQGGIDEVVETVTNAGVIIGKNLVKIIPQIVQGVTGIINGLIPQIPKLIKTLLPSLVNGVISLMQGLVNALPEFLTVLAEMLPSIITSFIEAFHSISLAIADSFPTIVPLIVQGLVDSLIAVAQNADLLIDGAVALVVGLTEGLLTALPILVEQAPYIVGKLASALIASIPTLLEAAIKLGLEIPAGVSKAIGSMKNIGVQLAKGLWNGLSGMKQWVIDKVKGMGKSILKGLKNVLGIHSPSTEFAFIGKMSVLGYTDELESMKKELNSAIQETFAIDPYLANTTSLHYSPNVVVNNQMNLTTDPLGQVVGNIKTFANGSKNDYNYGMGV